jgi:RNA polymerase sigma-70 factor (ECF subfamily)
MGGESYNAPRTGEISRREDLLSDPELVVAIREGYPDAFDTLYRTHVSALWGFALQFVHTPDVAKDIVQDVFTEIWVRRASWEPRTTVRAYLFRAVRNRAISVLRHEHTVQNTERVMSANDEAPGMGEEPLLADEQTVTNEVRQALRTAIDALPERQRTALLLWWHKGMNATEIAVVLQISAEAARKLLAKAQHKLLQLIENL